MAALNQSVLDFSALHVDEGNNYFNNYVTTPSYWYPFLNNGEMEEDAPFEFIRFVDDEILT